jgi:glutamine amidotransferase
VTTVGVVDYGMGNLRSVQKAIERVAGEAGVACKVVATAEAIDRCDGLILPGVGAFGDGMAQLDRRGLADPIRVYARDDRPMLGVCLGMQLLFDRSAEGHVGATRDVPGLGLIPGRVVLIEPPLGPRRMPVPHMGWNTLDWTGDDPLLAGLTPGCHVYFVHAYHAEAEAPSAVVATSAYGRPLAAVVRSGRLWGTQFHPEKSQAVGLRMLGNFVAGVAPGHAPGPCSTDEALT